MKIIIWNDEYLVHSSCFNKAYYRLNKQGYYYCNTCSFKCPSLLINLPRLNYYSYGHNFWQLPKTIIKEVIYENLPL